MFYVERLVFCTLVEPGCPRNELAAAQVILITRFLAILTHILTTALIALIARTWAGPWAGLLGACAWLTLPHISAYTGLALTEAWQALGMVASVYFATTLLQTPRPRAAIFSTAAGLLAVVFKYSAFPVLSPGIAAVVWLGWKHPDARTRWLVTLIAQAALIVGCAAWLLFGYGSQDLFANPNEVAEVISVGENENVEFWSETIGLPRILIAHADQVGFSAPVLWGLLALGMAFAWRRAPAWKRFSWLLALGLVAAHLIFILAYIIFWSGVTRYVTPVAGITVALLASALVALADWIVLRLRAARWLGISLAALAAIIWLGNPTLTSIQIARERALPDTHYAYMRWTETSLPLDQSLLIDTWDWYLFTDRFASYGQPERTWVQGKLYDYSRTHWLGNFVRYAAVLEADQPQLEATYGADIASLLPLKRFPPVQSAGGWRGPILTVYRLERPAHTSDARFQSQIHLVGFDLSAATLTPSSEIVITPFWRADTRPETNYHIFIHLTPMDGIAVLAQIDGVPGLSARPTTTWDDPAETIIGSTLTLTLPADIASGEYRLIAGLYDPQSGVRLQTDDGQDYTLLTRIAVNSAP